MTRQTRRGFTLTELLVVLAIMAVIIGMLLPATRRVRTASVRMQCSNHLKQLMMGVHSFQDASQSSDLPRSSESERPDGAFLPPGCFGPETKPNERLSWMVAVLPYVEENNLYQRFDLKAGYVGNLPVSQAPINLFHCPSASEKTQAGITTYVALSGITPGAASHPKDAAGNGFMGYHRQTSLTMITDGTSNTIALIETRSDNGPWACGGTATLRGLNFADVPLIGNQRSFGAHDTIANVAFADGSVRAIRSSVDPRALAAAVTIAGGEVVPLD